MLYEVKYFDSERRERNRRLNGKDEADIRRQIGPARKVVYIRRVALFHAYGVAYAKAV